MLFFPSRRCIITEGQRQKIFSYLVISIFLALFCWRRELDYNSFTSSPLDVQNSTLLTCSMPFTLKKVSKEKTLDEVQTSFNDHEIPLSCPPSYYLSLTKPNCKTEIMEFRKNSIYGLVFLTLTRTQNREKKWKEYMNRRENENNQQPYDSKLVWKQNWTIRQYL